ncbi:MAG: LptF/LptG family permease [Candidatus Binataceae bacterium]
MVRGRLSPTIDRFLARGFFEPFVVSLIGFTAVSLLGDVFERFDDLVRYGGFGLLGLEYFALKLPLMITQMLPAACLAGVLLGFALLNRNGEVLACQQLGISRLEMAVPVLMVAVLISIADFVFTETIVPLATRQARYLYNVDLKKRKIAGVFANRNIWVRVRDGFLCADAYDARSNLLKGVTLYQIGPDYSIRDIVHARHAWWDGKSWRPEGVSRLHLGPGGEVTAADADGLRIDVKPSDFGMLRLDPEEFSLWELNRYIHGLRRKGLDPGGYVVDRDLKYTTPPACLIMVALGVGLSLDPLPRRLSLGRSFGLAIGIGFGYWLMLGLTASLGRSGLIPAPVAALIPDLTFGAIALGIFLFGEER